MVAKGVFWGSLGAICWTHAGYPLLAASLARLRPQPVARGDVTPSVAVIVAAHDEEAVIGGRLENLLALDYPAGPARGRRRLGRVDRRRPTRSSTAAAARDERVRLLRVPRGGKVAAQDRAVAATSAEIVAFSDANTLWSADALRLLVRSFADPDVAYVCGAHTYEGGDGTNREGVYARFEGWLRRGRVAVRLGDGWRRSDLRRAPQRLRRARPALRARPRAPVSPRPPRPPRGRRPGGARVGEAGPRHRGRVPAEAADVRALLADRASRRHAPRRPAALRAPARVAPAPPLRDGLPAPVPAARVRAPRVAPRPLSSSRSAPSSRCSASRRSGPGSPATTSSSPGRRCPRSPGTSGAGCRRCGSRRPGRGDRGAAPGRTRRAASTAVRAAAERSISAPTARCATTSRASSPKRRLRRYRFA